MNESLFILQIIIIVSFSLGALRLGKSALTAWVSMLMLLANLLVFKQINLFGFNVTASDAYAVGGLLGINFLQEYYGKEEAKKATWICFFSMVFFTIVSQLHLFFIPNEHDTAQLAYSAIFSHAPRLLAASMAVFFVVQRLDILLFELVKKIFANADFMYRAAITLVCSQVLDTVLFSCVGLYGLVGSLLDVILVSLVIKLAATFFLTPFLKLAKS